MTAAYPKMQFPFFSRYHLHVNSSDLCLLVGNFFCRQPLRKHLRRVWWTWQMPWMCLTTQLTPRCGVRHCLLTRGSISWTQNSGRLSKICGSVPLYSLLITLQEGGGNENEVFFQLRCHWRSLWHHSVVQHVVRHWTHLQPSLCLQSGFQEFARPLWLVSMLDLIPVLATHSWILSFQ